MAMSRSSAADLRNRLQALKRTGPSHIEGEVLSAHHRADEWITGEVEISGKPVRWAARGLGGLEVGRYVRITGYYDVLPDLGSYYLIQEVLRSELPQERRATIRYLTHNVPGVGPKIAEHLVMVLGASGCLKTLREHPEIVRQLWSGKKGQLVEMGLRTWLRSQRDEAWMMSAVPMLMAAADVSHNLARRICTFCTGSDVVDVILRVDPYLLLDVPGIGWATADAIAKRLGVSHSDTRRAEGAILWTVDRARGAGHSALPREDAIRRAADLAAIVPTLAAEATEGLIRSYRLVEGFGLLYRPEVHALEEDVAVAFGTLAARHIPLHDDQRRTIIQAIQPLKLTDEQRSAVLMALESGLSVLTGGPGTGKTSTLRALLTACETIGIAATVLAPTGKAASRASQVTGHPAFTIHKQLSGAEQNSEKNVVPQGLLIVEECSMLDIEVAAWLVSHIRLGRAMRVLMVGDHKQLPPVAHGALLADLLRVPSVPRTELSIVHRQAAGSAILRQAHRLRRGESLEAVSETADWRWVNLPSGPAEAAHRVVQQVKVVLREEKRSILRAEPFVPSRDLQLFTPITGKHGEPLGAKSLNAALRSLVNPRGSDGPFIHDGIRARVGDRVTALSNDYETGLMNGETGIVRDVDPFCRKLTLEIEDGRRIEVKGVHTRNLGLAYASTIHRGQGSEVSVAIVVLHDSQVFLADASLLYTAITRARDRVILCCTSSALQRAIKRGFSSSARTTGLSFRLARELESRGIRPGTRSQVGVGPRGGD